MNTVERIVEMCQERVIAVSRLEKDCGFSNGYIRNLREGKIPADRLFTIARYLQIKPEYLLTGEGPMVPYPEPDPEIDAQEQLLLTLFREFNEIGRLEIIHRIRELACVPRYTNKDEDLEKSYPSANAG